MGINLREGTMKIIRVRKTIEYQGEEAWVENILSRSILAKGKPLFRAGKNNRIKLIEQTIPIVIHESDEERR